MVFRITNYCTMNCVHCMEESTVNGKHASDEIIDGMINFARKTMTHLPIHKDVISISGGEPTSHPEFFNIMKRVTTELNSKKIVVLSHGEYFLTDLTLRDKMIELLLYNPNVELQITSIDGLYRNSVEIVNKIKTAINNNMFPETIKHRLTITTTLENDIIPIGRTVNNIEVIEKVSYISKRQAMSCFNMFNVLSKMDGSIWTSVEYTKMNSNSSLCKPLIKENGDIIFGEYEACSTVANVKDMPSGGIEWRIDINDVSGPCGACMVTQKQFDITRPHVGCYRDYGKKSPLNN